ncbi:glycerate kinase [Flammeovirga sp. MY04]|uniref:glycerate kinase n=1 Tax=Flammeovirga sp. MY04 TaxID=1191459 RepID=UPI000806200E|nr:glycerate kinase [Flammeovirga sp. MY04]ANQ48390.1 glycerate kinase [Flammeovirga sp. MY04]
MKIVIAPNAFKSSISSIEAANIIQEAWLNNRPNDEVVSLPLADGGDDFDHVIALYKNGTWNEVATVNALNQPHTSGYYKVNNATAVIGMASVCGLADINEGKRNALEASSRGLGIVMMQAINDGCKEIIIGLGGSASTDFGLGALAELGLLCFNDDGTPIQPNGGNLSSIRTFDIQELLNKIEGISFYIAVDVENGLLGKNGAAHVFGPQKGANQEDIKVLDDNLSHAADLTQIATSIEVHDAIGSGAAGGTAGGFMAFLNATILKGSEFVMDCSGFEDQLSDTNLIITSEGTIDDQSLYGKLPYQVAIKGNELKIPVLALVGNNKLSTNIEHPFYSIFNINQKFRGFDDMLSLGKENLYKTVEEIAKIFSLKHDM